MSINLNINKIHKQAISSFFEIFETLAEGALATDREAKVVWINDKYLDFLGIENKSTVIGKPVNEVVPGSQIPTVLETGEPIPLDLMEFPQGWCLVARFPVKSDNGKLIGAFGFLLYDKISQLKPLFEKVRKLEKELSATLSQLSKVRRAKYSISHFVGNSKGARTVKQLARAAAQQNSTVILYGETGTGKELLANAIHLASTRSLKNFVGINLAAIPDTLLEAEFFGAAPGAFSGGRKEGRIGKMQLADGGTLFFDEVANMPMSIQVKLLRALQEREIEPLGGNKVINVDIRIIAATSLDLKKLVQDGEFRSDLYYRIHVFPIRIPPLRERLGDISLLCEVLLEDIGHQQMRPPREISDEAIDCLRTYHWPGNVRELRNILERACTITRRATLECDDIIGLLPFSGKSVCEKDDGWSAEGLSMPQAVAKLEKDMMSSALRHSGGKKSQAAELLGIPRSTFYVKARQYGIGKK